VGLAAVGLALVWNQNHPAVPMLELAESPTFQCGSTPFGTYGRHPWVIRNGGSEPLRIRTRFTSGRSGFSLWQGEEHVIEPGVQITVHLTWVTPTRVSVPFSSYATLWTNDPQRAEFRLRVVGTSGLVIP
jgi:hypothetical protein